MKNVYEEGDIAIVTTESGHRYVGVYTLATGIDYFWNPVIKGTGTNQFTDPDKSVEVIGSTGCNYDCDSCHEC